MSKIFISHSSANNAAALAIAEWLRENGWDEFFLDINPARGLAPGERWQEALKTAADRCEAVLFLISAAWRDSRWCQAEFLLAKQLGKTIFGVVIEAIPFDTLPPEITAEWQLCDLVSGGEQRVFHVQADPLVAATAISFATLGLQKLRFGLQKAGLDPATFPWPPAADPSRAPYQGLKALDVEDAAIFFGREAAIVRGLDALRGLREHGVERMFVILGASGSGKSSFLRAGLWPRLARDDRHFLPLPVIRPERAVLSGSTGLIASLEVALRQRKRSVTRAVIRTALETASGFERLLSELQASAMSALATEVVPPTIVLPIDQAEELFATDGQEEAHAFLTLLGHTLAPPVAENGESMAAQRRLLAVLAIRSDSHERLQTAPQLVQVKASLFDLRPLATVEYKAVIEGPAARATLAGQKLRIDPELTAQLLDDAAGADALPLLAFTLERLLVEYGGDGDLRKEEYEALGGIRGAIAATIHAAFAAPYREPVIPVAKAEQDQLLRTAFIPWLARIDPDTEERKRRVARWEELPIAARALVERLISQRLMVRDRRRIEDSEEEVVVVEVAHEALLRQWTSLVTWLDADADRLKQLEVVQRAAEEWHKNDANEAWLVHSGMRLESALTLGQQPDFAGRLGHAGSAYLAACQAREARARAEREAERQRALDDAKRLAEESEKRRQAEEQRAQEAEARVKDRDAAAARLRRRAWMLTGVAALAVVAAVASGIFYFRGEQQREVALARQLAAQAKAITSRNLDLLQRKILLATTSLRMASTPEARQILYEDLSSLPMWGTRIAHQNKVHFSPDSRYVVTGGDKTAQVWDLSRQQMLFTITHQDKVRVLRFSPDSRYVATASEDKTAQVWDLSRQQMLFPITHQDAVWGLSFSPDSRYVVTGSRDKTAQVWDLSRQQMLFTITHQDKVRVLSFSPDSRYVVTGSEDKTAQVWDLSRQQMLFPITHQDAVWGLDFSPDSRYVVTGGDKTAQVWDLSRQQMLFTITHQDAVGAPSFSPDSRYVATGSGDKTAQVWDLSRQQMLFTITHQDAVGAPSFSPDSRYVATGSGDKTAQVWDLSRQRVLFTITHQDAVGAPSFSPDSRYVATRSGDTTAQVWDLSCQQMLFTITHQAGVGAPSFSPDSRYVATVSGDKTAQVWDLSRQQMLFTITHQDEVLALRFSPDSRYVATASQDNIVQVIDWHRRDPLTESCVHLTRNLTAQEWHLYAAGEAYRFACPNLPGPDESMRLAW